MIVFLDGNCSLILHCCSLFDKYDSNHFNSMLEMPKRIIVNGGFVSVHAHTPIVNKDGVIAFSS